MNGSSGLTAADVMALGKDNNFLEGNGILIILFFLILLGGFGGNMFGGNKGGYEVPATKDFVTEQINHHGLVNEVHAIGNNVTTNGYETRNAVMSIGTQLQDCCCNINRNIDSLRYENSKNTCDIINAGHNETQRILDAINHYVVEQKDIKIAEQGQLLSEQRIISAMKPVAPIPSYTVPNPYCNYGYGCNTPCGNLY